MLFISSFLVVSMKTIQEVKKEVMDFLELKKAKKVLLVVDDDEDGMTSAFQMKKFLEESEQKVTLHFNEKRSIAPGAINEEEEFLELVKSDDSKLIIFCDLNEEIASQKLGLIDSKIKVLIIDHHPTPKEFLIKNELMVVKPGDFSNKTPANYSATKVIFDLFNIDAIAALIGVVGDSSLGDWEEFGEKIMQENSVSLEQVTRLANVIKSIVSNYGSRKKELFEFVYEKGSFVSLLGSEYEELAKQFEELILEISDLLDYKNIHIFDTSVAENNILIKYFVEKIKFDVTDEELDKLYYIGNNDHRLNESSGTVDETKINLHRRFLVTYLPDFISKVTGLEDQSVFVVENIQQVKAIITARNISKNKKLFHLAYLPTPSVDGKARMYSSSNEQKLFLKEKDYVIKLLKEANEKVMQYYFSIIPSIGKKGEVNMPKSNVKDYFLTINEVFKNG